MTPERVLEIAVVKDMFRKAIRRGFDEPDKWAEQRHVERELDLRLGLWAAEAVVAESIAQVFEVPVSAEDWETHLSAHCFAAEDYQQTMQVACRQRGSTETDVQLETSVYSVPEEDWEEGDEVSHSFGLIRDPPAAVFDPAIHDLEAVADEVMDGIPNSQRGHLRKRFELAEFELHLPLPRRDAVEAFRGPFAKLPAYEGDVGMTSFLRLENVPAGAGTVSLWASIHQEADETAVTAHLQGHLRSADERPEVERRLDQVATLLEAAAPTA